MALLVNALGYKAAFAAFELILQDVSRTPAGWCPICAFNLVNHLRDGTASLHALQREHHSLWDSCIRQLVTSRPAEVEDALRAQLRRNIDSCPNTGAYHDERLSTWERDYITDPLMLFRSLICFCLARCLYGFDNPSDSNPTTVLSRARNPRKRFRSSDDLWPRHPDQLFPLGSARTAAALCLACLTWNDDGPWYILNAVVQLARPRVIGLITQVDQVASNLGMKCLEIIFHGSGYAMQVSYGTPTGELHTLKLPDTPWLRSGAGRRAVNEFLRTLWEGPYARPDEMYRFLSYHMDGFRAAYSVIVERSVTTGDAVWDSILRSIHVAAPHMHEARQLVSAEQVALRIEQSPRSSSVILATRVACRYLRSARRCSGPDCTRTTLDEDADRPPLQTCARCKLARYCSAGCQRSDWRGGPARVPHKRICAVLAALQSIADSFSNLDGYEEAVRASDISDSELALVGRWAASLSQHYVDLIRMEIAFPDMFIDPSSDSEGA